MSYNITVVVSKVSSFDIFGGHAIARILWYKIVILDQLSQTPNVSISNFDTEMSY